MSQKSTPKSCSCRTCTRGKATKAGKLMMRQAERSFRHQNKIHLNQMKDSGAPAPVGGYFD